MKVPIPVLGVGVVTCVGLDARQSAASVRAGISGFRESAILARHFEPIVMGLLPDDALPLPDPMLVGFPGVTDREVRMLRLAGLAIRDALKEVSPAEPLPAFVALPAAPDVASNEPRQELLNLLMVQSKVKLELSSSRLHAGGRAAGIQALKEALGKLEDGSARWALVGGMDTYLDDLLIARLTEEGRISTAYNPDGFVPGEGAGFLLLSSPSYAKGCDPRPMGFIEGIGLGVEPGHRYGGQPYKGDGLAEAFRNLAEETTGNDPIKTVFAGFNGESYHAKEWGVAFLRHRARFSGDMAVEHPADCIGDTGAAMAPIMIGLALSGMVRGYLAGPCAIWCTSDDVDCGAVRINTGA